MSRVRAEPILATVTVTVLLLTLVGGCTVRSRPAGESSGPVAVEILASNEAEWDLREPLTRDDVGMPEGQNSIALGHAGGEPLIAVHLDLPTTSLDLEATEIYIYAGEQQVETLRVVTSPTVEEVARVVQREVDRLGLPRQSVDLWLEMVPSMFDPDTTYTRRAISGRSGDLELVVEVSNPGVEREPMLAYELYLVDPLPGEDAIDE